MKTDQVINIRPAVITDKEFIIGLVPRLLEFGPPAWRNVEEMVPVDIQVLSEEIANPLPGTAIFIAEDDKSTALGFIHLQWGKDYYYKERHVHITNIVIDPKAEGRGIARLLFEKAEEWARLNKVRFLTLSVFAQNVHARKVYKKLGYGEDIIKCVKEINY